MLEHSGWQSTTPYSIIPSSQKKEKTSTKNINLYSKWQSIQKHLFDQKSTLWSPLQVPQSQISYSSQERASWQAIWTSLRAAKHEELIALNKASRCQVCRNSVLPTRDNTIYVQQIREIFRKTNYITSSEDPEDTQGDQ